MTGQELRGLVERIVSERLAARAAAPPGTGPAHATSPADQVDRHPSHALYVSVVNIDETCVIEPGVSCHHCGYCKSHGH